MSKCEIVEEPFGAGMRNEILDIVCEQMMREHFVAVYFDFLHCLNAYGKGIFYLERDNPECPVEILENQLKKVPKDILKLAKQTVKLVERQIDKLGEILNKEKDDER